MPTHAPPAAAVVGQAPGQLGVVQAFVNTLDIEQSTDLLHSPQALAEWIAVAGLSAAGHPAIHMSAADLKLALELREAVRGVLRSHVSGSSAPAEAISRLATIATGFEASFTVAADGSVRMTPAGTSTRAALTEILLIAAAAAADGTWARLKACTADDCQWAFYDRSPTRNGCWCSMQVCGSRAKSRAFRARTAAGTRAAAGRRGARGRTAGG